jgi:hypothetical protein
MNQVILFGGGDAGGFYIDPNGHIHRIPPYTPYLVSLVRSFGALVQAEHRARGEDKAELATLADSMQTALVAHVERTAGPVAAQAGIVSYDPEDGFVCGNGPHRFPIPHPHGESIAAALETVTASH